MANHRNRLIASLILCTPLYGQASLEQPRKLAFITPGFIQSLIGSADPDLQRFLRSNVNPSFASVNSALATQLSNLPVPSPASGYRYTFDPSLGVYVKTVQSLGPVLTERAETLGRTRYFFALTYQRYSFDRIDQLDLRGFDAAIPLQIPLGAVGTLPILVQANTLLSLTINQTTAHFTYGLLPTLDISLAFPMIRSSIAVSSEASVKELVRGQPLVSVPRRWAGDSASGVGDTLIRVKNKLASKGALSLAFAADLRLPTGDELNYHGAGAYGVKPFLIVSAARRRLSPHVNVGYQWNGSSFLASPAADRKQRLPSQVFYALGTEIAFNPKITATFDYLDQWIPNGQRSLYRDVQAADGNTYQTLFFPYQLRRESNGSTGFKVSLPRDLVLTWNMLFRLNSTGLRARIVPMFGLSLVL